MFYATDDARAATVVERLITAAGFDPVRAGGLKDAGRLELPDGDLRQWGGLGGKVLDRDDARRGGERQVIDFPASSRTDPVMAPRDESALMPAAFVNHGSPLNAIDYNRYREYTLG